MKSAMESIKGMIDVNTVVGEAVETQDGTIIIPVSRVSLGFVAGGGQYGFATREDARPYERGERERDRERERERGNGEASGREWPFGGGSGAGVSVSPLGFLVVARQQAVRFLPVDRRANLERILDVAPDLIDRLQGAWKRGSNGKAREAREDAARAVSEAVARSEGYDDDYEDI